MRFLNKKRSVEFSGKPSLTLKISALLLMVVVLVICWKVGTRVTYSSANTIPTSEDGFDQQFPNLTPSEGDLFSSPEETVEIDLNNYSDQIVFTEAGSYVLHGNLDGQILIDVKDETVHLFLNGVSVKAKNGPAILVESANKAVITLIDGSNNTISDSGNFTDQKYEACIYSNCNLTFNGTGSIEVSGLYKDAIRSKDILKIIDGNYQIHSKRTGLRGNDGLLVAGGTIFIGSEKYGLKTTKTGAEDRGNLVVSGGILSVVAGQYAFVTEKSNLYIFDCEVHTNSVVNDFNVKGSKVIQDGCIQ